ncbi:MAG: DUF2442 domain-containing protein [Gammaproteobacteria bacterium]|nr:DUF2442 domain-containing protein [Gammaproteobacteria bacterium]
MGTLTANINPLAQSVTFTDNEMSVRLVDGRTLTVPLAWFPLLAGASNEQLHNYQILGDGEGIHWPDLDEDLSVKGLLLGNH